jgi:hypothetical protein
MAKSRPEQTVNLPGREARKPLNTRLETPAFVLLASVSLRAPIAEAGHRAVRFDRRQVRVHVDAATALAAAKSLAGRAHGVAAHIREGAERAGAVLVPEAALTAAAARETALLRGCAVGVHQALDAAEG